MISNIVKKGEVLPMVLTLYMVDQDLPLPTKNEVWLCTQSTTKEEVSYISI